MFVRGAGVWYCTSILDWDCAARYDLYYDLAHLDGFRFAPVGPVPPEFFAAYGRTPSSPLYPLYRVERAAWILDAHARGVAWPAESVPLAESFLRSRIGA